MTNNKTEQIKSLITKPMTTFALVIATAVVVATIACSGERNCGANGSC